MPRLIRSPVARLWVRAGFQTAREAGEAAAISRVFLLEVAEGAALPSDALIARMAGSYACPRAAVVKAVKSARRDWLKRQLESLDDWA